MRTRTIPDAAPPLLLGFSWVVGLLHIVVGAGWLGGVYAMAPLPWPLCVVHDADEAIAEGRAHLLSDWDPPTIEPWSGLAVVPEADG
jgi:hypothetical protein